MAGFRVNSFSGALPIIDPQLLQESNAQSSRNQRVESGALDPLGQPRFLKNLNTLTRFVYRIPNGERSNLAQSYWIEFNDVYTDMVRTPVVNDGYKRYYWASPSTGFRYAAEADLITGGAGVGLIGGVPRPDTSPTLDVLPLNNQVEGELKITRSYVVTFVSNYGEEGPPSLPVEAEGYAGDIWRLRDIPQPVIQQGYTDIDYVRIYRTETAASGSTVFNQVIDLQVGQFIYEDTRPSVIVNGQPALDANDNEAPPSMDGLALMPNGILVGFKGNSLFFSKNYQPHAWPVAYTLAVQHPIVGLAVFGNTCVVCTEGNPAAVTGTSGDTMTLTQSDVSMPCVSRKSIAVGAEGVYYATSTGIVLYTASGPQVITDKVIGRQLWQRDYSPSQIDAVIYQGAYVGMRNILGGYSAFHFIEGSITEIFVQDLYEFCGCGLDVWSNKPWLIQGGKLYDWLPYDTPPRVFDWLSKKFRMPNRVSMGVMQVYADGPVTVTVYADDDLILSKTITNTDPVRLPGGYKTDIWSVGLNGSSRVHLVMVAQTVADLKKQ